MIPAGDPGRGPLLSEIQNSMYDIIGDIHGHAEELVKLPELLGYEGA